MNSTALRMKTGTLPTRLRWAFPFAVLTKPDTVRLVAGEEYRYTLRSPSLDQWLPCLLGAFKGEVEWRPLLDELPTDCQQQALEIIARLYGERVLLEGNGEDQHLPSPFRWIVEGSGKLGERLRADVPAVSADAAHLDVLCQDTLDYAAALDFNRRCHHSGAVGWLWVSCGPMGRGFVSPIFRPRVGPCLGCLLRNFQRLSPAPEIYEHLIEHSRAGGEIPPAPFPPAALDLLAALARWKLEVSVRLNPSAGLYRLHVLEIGAMDCTTHRVFRDPHCPDCSPA
jgi:bacteriocin biosynthesis cyclodehydratase domain-containing protein